MIVGLIVNLEEPQNSGPLRVTTCKFVSMQDLKNIRRKGKKLYLSVKSSSAEALNWGLVL